MRELSNFMIVSILCICIYDCLDLELLTPLNITQMNNDKDPEDKRLLIVVFGGIG